VVLIIIDGLDASGKNTQAIRLADFLKKQGKTVFLRFHPSSDSFFGIKTKQFLYSTGKKAHFAAAFFYSIDVVRSILLYSWREYDYIVFVRYLMGTAYLPSPMHKFAYRFFAALVPTSRFMFFLDVTPEEASRRIRLARRNLEMFENPNRLEQTRQKALSLALTDNWTIINANESMETVENEIRKVLLENSGN